MSSQETMLNRNRLCRNGQMTLLPVIMLAVVAVYIQMLWHGFVNLDDPVVIYSNTYIRSGLTLEGIRWAFTSDFVSNWVPLTMVSHMLDVQLFGMNPAGHHAVNGMVHLGSTALLYLFFCRAAISPGKSAVIALIFALHPLQVEPVAWIAERKDVLCAFFWMMALYCYVLYSEKRTMGRYATVLACFAFSLLAKPMAVTLPAVLLLLDWWPLGRFTSTVHGSPDNPISRLIVEKIPFAILSVAVSIITVVVKGNSGEIIADYNFMEKVFRACVLYFKYLAKVFLPMNLAVFYPGTDVPPTSSAAAVALIAIAVGLFFVFRARHRYPYLVTGTLWFLITLLPVIGIIQSGACTFADRYVYLPLIGLAVIMVCGSGDLLARLHVDNKVIFSVSAVLILSMMAVTARQLSYWKNSFRLLSHAIEVTEGNWLALNNLGQEYLSAGKIDEAIWYFNESVKAKPSYVIAWVNLGALLSLKNRQEEAAVALRQALLLEPGNQKAQLLLQALAR